MHNGSQTALLIALLGATLFAADSNAQQNDPLQEWPQWVQDAMQKESRRTKMRKVKTPDDSVHTKLPGKLSQLQEIEAGWYFQSDIGAESPLECYLFTEGQDVATLTNLMAEENIKAVAANNNSTVDNRRILDIQGGAIEGVPYLALEWIYTIKNESQTAVGFTKVRAASKGDVGYACAHNYLGYRETFAKIFSEFVASTEYEDATVEPYYEEIASMDFAGRGAGLAYSAFSTDEDGDIKMYVAEAAITPVDAETIVASDSVQVVYSTQDGEMINAVDVTVENGEIVSNLSLQTNDAGNWVSSGTLQGKNIEYEIDGTESPATTIEQIQKTRELFAGDESSVTMGVWVPSADPTRFLPAEIVRDDAEKERQAILTIGPLRFLGQFDQDGSMMNAEMYIGPVTINIERIWSRGSLVQ